MGKVKRNLVSYWHDDKPISPCCYDFERLERRIGAVFHICVSMDQDNELIHYPISLISEYCWKYLAHLSKGQIMLSNGYIATQWISLKKTYCTIHRIDIYSPIERPGLGLTLTLYALTLVCIFSTLFFIHFLKCWQGECVKQSKATSVGDHFPNSCDLNV